jgi:hypothetical protein
MPVTLNGLLFVSQKRELKPVTPPEIHVLNTKCPEFLKKQNKNKKNAGKARGLCRYASSFLCPSLFSFLEILPPLCFRLSHHNTKVYLPTASGNLFLSYQSSPLLSPHSQSPLPVSQAQHNSRIPHPYGSSARCSFSCMVFAPGSQACNIFLARMSCACRYKRVRTNGTS